MRILAVDTTGVFGSIALAEGDRLMAEVPLHSTDGFAHLIFGQIEAMLARHSCPLSAIDLFAATSGPGSFTGVRVGLTAIKGLAEACGRPAAAFSNLQAMARFGTLPLRAPLLDARRGQIFGGLYDGDLRTVAPEVVASFGDFLATVPAGTEIIGQDLAPFEPLLGDRPRTVAPRSLASAVAALALVHGGGDPALLDANYVRRSDAELMWQDKR